MPTADRYALNDLQQSVLDVLAAALGEGCQALTRDEIIERVVAIPGLDDTTGMSLGPCLAALKRRGLVTTPTGSTDGWYITAQGLGYVDQEEGESASSGPSLDVTLSTPPLATEPAADITGTTDERLARDLARDELLEKLALEVEKWPRSTEDELPAGWVFRGPYVALWGSGDPRHMFSRAQWLAERERLLGKPSRGDALEVRPAAEPCAEGREERPIARGLDLLLAQEDLASRHDGALQGELFQVLKGLVVHTNRTRSQLPPDDPRVRELGEFAEGCLQLADQVATSLIVPGRSPVQA